MRGAGIIDRGHGAPIVLIPGIQGRWEYMLPAVRALSRRARVVTFSLCGEPGSLVCLQPQLGFGNFVRQIDRALDLVGLERATVLGISYGGLVALRYAAERPARVERLILASTPGPHWSPDARVRFYMRAPTLLSPVFLAGSIRRLHPELSRAYPTVPKRVGFALRQAGRFVRAPISPRRMAQRVRLLEGIDFEADARRICAPSLIVTGERRLDRVVDTRDAARYLALLPKSEFKQLEETGHLGLITRPDEFAETVVRFASGGGTIVDPDGSRR